MATKVTILGEQPIEQEKKKIELVWWADCDLETYGGVKHKPSEYEQIILIERNYRGGEYDLIYAIGHSSNASLNTLFFGRFNDGIV